MSALGGSARILARATIGDEDYGSVVRIATELAKLERSGAITRQAMEKLIAELAEEVADEWVAKRVATGCA